MALVGLVVRDGLGTWVSLVPRVSLVFLVKMSACALAELSVLVASSRALVALVTDGALLVSWLLVISVTIGSASAHCLADSSDLVD